MPALVTGSAGFIGAAVAQALLDAGHSVVGVDSHNRYYDPALKTAREARLLARAGYTGVRGTIETPGLLDDLFARHRPDRVIHLAAQAGVRHSIDNPAAYVAANLAGTAALLQAARTHPPRHLLMASTSSVYGANTAMPYAETDKADTPLSFYAATKKATEAMAHSYSHLFGLPVTMVRFFTVYGPWGRPDMAPHLFTRAIIDGAPIRVFNRGAMRRDFTYVDDLVAAILRLVEVVPGTPLPDGDSHSPVAPYRIVNIGAGAPTALTDFIAAIETATGRRAVLDLQPMQPGDVPATWADTTLLRRLTGAVPATPLADGVAAWVAWFRDHYGA